MEAQQTPKNTGPWTELEHAQFMEGVRLHGKDWTKIVSFVPSRTGTQIRSHAQKFFNKLEYSFESRAILGLESERIMGPPMNQSQYALYKQVGKLLQMSITKQNQDFYMLDLFLFVIFILVSKRRGLRQNLDRDQPLQKRNSKRSQDIRSINEQEMSCLNSSQQQAQSLCQTDTQKNNSSYLYEVISSNQNEYGIGESINNFMKLYVDLKPLSPRKSSNIILQNEPMSTQHHKSSNNCQDQDEINGALKIKNSCNTQTQENFGGH